MFFCTSISVPFLWQVITTLHMLVHSSMLWPCHWLIQAGTRQCRASLSSLLIRFVDQKRAPHWATSTANRSRRIGRAEGSDRTSFGHFVKRPFYLTEIKPQSKSSSREVLPKPRAKNRPTTGRAAAAFLLQLRAGATPRHR